jgi:hypothetical protein
MSTSQTESKLDLIGFLKYEGKLVEDGILDAKSAAKALFGFDHALRYFITQAHPDLATIQFPIPVQIQRGSWLAVIPSSAEALDLVSMLSPSIKRQVGHAFTSEHWVPLIKRRPSHP